jgi:hypothetical protein
MSKNLKLHNLTLKMEENYPFSFYGAVVKGKKGLGKSTYCIHCLAQLFLLVSRVPDKKRYMQWIPDDKEYRQIKYKIGLEEAYHLALDHTFFDFRDIVRTLYRAKGALKDVRLMVPGIIWDDAGVYGGSQVWWEDKAKYGAIKKYSDILRTRLTGWLVNTPVEKGLLTSLRKTDDPIIDIVDNSGAPRKTEDGCDVTINKYRSLATAKIEITGSRWGRTIFTDDFRRRLPYSSVHERYVEMKEEAFGNTEDDIIDTYAITDLDKNAGNKLYSDFYNKRLVS